MKKEIIIDDYSTKDFIEAAFLYALNKKLIKTNNTDSKTIWFSFSNKPDCEKAISSYYRKEAMVNAKEFADAIRTIKDIIFNQH